MAPGSDTFLTIDAPSEGVFKEKGSRFLAFAFPVSTEEEVKQIVAGLRQKYFDARHHCYAFRLGARDPLFRVSDDGEPSNSAGKPILGQIIAFGLTNILVVVVRYFGGILLGVGGLVQAYKHAACEALSVARIIPGTLNKHFLLQSDYATMDLVLKIARDLSGVIYDQQFHESCEAKVRIREGLTEEFLNKLQRIHTLSIQPIPSNIHSLT